MLGVGTCFLFSCLSRKQSRLQASTSVTEARLREPETCPFAAGKKVTATFMAHGSGPWEWRRRPWPWCFLCQRHQILATACLPVSHEVLLSRIQQQKKKKKAGTTAQAGSRGACRLPDMRMCAVQNMCRPGAPCLSIAQAQPIRHDANSRAAGDRLIDHWSWRGGPAALVSLHCSTLSASNPERIRIASSRGSVLPRPYGLVLNSIAVVKLFFFLPGPGDTSSKMIGGARTKVNHGAAFFPAASASLLAILTRVVCHVPSLLAS